MLKRFYIFTNSIYVEFHASRIHFDSFSEAIESLFFRHDFINACVAIQTDISNVIEHFTERSRPTFHVLEKFIPGFREKSSL